MVNPFTSRSAGASMPTDWDAQQRQIDYERKIAEQLAGDSSMPEGQMVGGIYVRPSITQHMAKALNPMMGRKRMEAADHRQQALNDQRTAERAGTLERFGAKLAGTPEQQLPADVFGPAAPAVPGDRNAAMQELGKSRDPMLQQLYMAQMLQGMKPGESFTLGEGQRRFDANGKEVAAVAPKPIKQEKPFIRTRVQGDQEVQEQLQPDGSYQEIGRGPRFARQVAPVVNVGEQSKKVPKLPTSALKMQQEELDAIGTSSSINADLGAMAQQIESGKLKLGMVDNLAAKAKNFVGASDESSRNLASFQATLEKLRNDSLRLNKGVQTEGDAQRAWNEMLTNINDPKLVKQRLAEIQKINERGANLRKMNVDVIRSNFGVDAMDTAPRQNVPAAVGDGAAGVDDLLKKYGG